ncbi:CpaF family protein [Novibacillus thermophilus]|nr:ATPase, T2SS/T4P/T4SS family [Novibacillus thermophilus]
MEGVSQLAERVKERIIQNTDNNDLFRLARAGDKKAVAETKTLVREQLYDMRINATNDLIQDIFNVIWGLGQIQHLYDDPEVNEIWVNGAGENVWVEREGRRVKAHGVMFQHDDEVMEIQARLLSNENKEINRSTPVVEAKMADGSRITLTRPDETPHPTITIRKHRIKGLTTEKLLYYGTLNQEVVDLLAQLVRGRANILLIGPTSSGKTSLLRWLTQFIDPNLRIGVLESTYELALDQYLKGRNIITFEEQKHLDRTLLNQFHTMLRLSPDIVILGEARGAEADQLVKTFRRGHPGSMGTIHSNSPEASIQDLVDMIMEDGRSWDSSHLYLRVARSVDVVIQLHVEPGTGIRRVWRITEVHCTETDNNVQFRDLCRFTGDTWEMPNAISDLLQAKLNLFDPPEDTFKLA